MKHRSFFAAAAALLALAAVTLPAAAVPQDAAPKAGGATLEETLKLLRGVLTRHGARVSGSTIMTLDAKDFRGCKITYEMTPQPAPDQQAGVPFIERVTLDLSALDPARVAVREGRGGAASLSVATRDGGAGIEFSLAKEPHLFGASSRFSSYSIALRKKAAAEEARGLMLRAIEQCRR